MDVHEKITEIYADRYAGDLSNIYIKDEDNTRPLDYDDIENAYKAGAKKEREYILKYMEMLIKMHKDYFASNRCLDNDSFYFGMELLYNHLKALTNS